MIKSLIIFLVGSIAFPVFCADYYVDQKMESSCFNYQPHSRTCGSGNDTAFAEPKSGLDRLSPGDRLILREGVYLQLDITRSGTITQPIIIEGMEGESVYLSGKQVAIRLINRSNIIIKNLHVNNVQGFARVENATRIIFDSIDFNSARASGTTGSLKFISSRYNKVLNSSFTNGSDLLIFQDNANFNLVEGNSFGRSSHSSISIRCASQNVFRGNRFDNPKQKAMEIYDCQGVSDAPVRYDDTKRNLIERNHFAGTKKTNRNHKYNAIQHCAQHTVVRYNSFTDNLGGGVNYQNYADECLFVYSNRLYNNTFYKNGCFAIIGRNAPSSRYYDNRVVNNLLFANTNCKGERGQTSINNSKGILLSSNSLVKKDPGFINTKIHNLNLKARSKQIDAGEFVAYATSSGQGSTLAIDDVSWFYDGYNIPGEVGDLIRIQGQDATARIVSIDYVNNTLSLSTPLSWQKGDGVHLNFQGKAPDIGAFEFDPKK